MINLQGNQSNDSSSSGSANTAATSPSQVDNQKSNVSEAHTASHAPSSNLVLVAKDFSVRSTASANDQQASLNGNNKRPMDSSATSSPLKVGPANSMSSVAQVSQPTTTPTKRSRTNGNVIGVNDVIAAAAAGNSSVSVASVGQLSLSSLTTSTTNATGGSKFVSGMFDLEEHIRALPQLGDTHLINSLHSRNQEMKNHSQPVSGISTPSEASLVVMSSQAGTQPNESNNKVLHSTFEGQPQTLGKTLNLISMASTGGTVQPGAQVFIKLAMPGTGLIATSNAPKVSVNDAGLVVSSQSSSPHLPGKLLVISGNPVNASHHVVSGANVVTPALSLISASGTPVSLPVSGDTHRPVDLSMIVNNSNVRAFVSSPGSVVTTSVPTAVSSSANGGNPSYSVISSQGSINQCDGLAALAEIALAQRRLD